MNWFVYDENGEKHGPISVQRLIELAKRGVVKRETIIENTEGWTGTAETLHGLDFPPKEPILDKEPLSTSQFVPRDYSNIDRAVHILSAFIYIGATIEVIALLILFCTGCVMMSIDEYRVVGVVIAFVFVPIGLLISALIYIFQMMQVETLKLMTHIAYDVHKTRWIAEEQMRQKP